MPDPEIVENEIRSNLGDPNDVLRLSITLVPYNKEALKNLYNVVSTIVDRLTYELHGRVLGRVEISSRDKEVINKFLEKLKKVGIEPVDTNIFVEDVKSGSRRYVVVLILKHSKLLSEELYDVLLSL